MKFPRSEKTQWFKIKNESSDSADLFLYDVIGDPWGENGIAKVLDQIRAIKAKKINLRINSPGGYVFDGIAIYNVLKDHGAEITTHIDGIAASIASVIAMVGKKICIADNAMLMIHNPSVLAAGYAEDLRKTADVLDQLKETIITTYENRTKRDRAELAKLMDDESYFDAKQSVDLGFADEISEGVKASACFDLAAFGYRNAAQMAATLAAKNKAISSTTPRSLLLRRQALIEKTVNQ